MRLSSGSIFREITGITSPVKVLEVDTLVGFTGDGWDTIVFELTLQQAKVFLKRIESDLSWKKVSLEDYFDKKSWESLRPYRCKYSNTYYRKEIYSKQNDQANLKLKEDNTIVDKTYTFCPDDLKLIYNNTYR